MVFFDNLRDSWIGNNQKRVYYPTKDSRPVKRNSVNNWRRENGVPCSYERYSKTYHDIHYTGKLSSLVDLIFAK